MIDSYLFIPASEKKFIKKSTNLKNLDYRVFDLEDSVSEELLSTAIKNISKINFSNNDWVRIPINIDYQINLIENISKMGMNNFIIPKIKGYEDFKNIYSEILKINSNAKIILLIENAKIYVELEKILDDFEDNIYGLSLGIHDFTFETNMKNDYRVLTNIRTKILLLARSYEVEPIDVVSMYLKDEEKLRNEIVDGFNLGYRSKFIIHPKQLEILNSVKFYSFKKIKEYKDVLKHYNSTVDYKDSLFSYNDIVYEKMHIQKIKKIVDWGEKFYKKYL
mgnify:CR=1 FL=1